MRGKRMFRLGHIGGEMTRSALSLLYPAHTVLTG